MLQIHLLGGIQLEYDGQPLKYAGLPKTLPLWAYLLLNAGQPLARPALAYTLWSDVGEEEARSNLRRHLYDLRRVLPPTPDERPWLLADNSFVEWNLHADYWLDVSSFVSLSRDADRMSEAVQLYRGDLLPEVDEEWLLFDRERLRTLFFDNLTQLISQHSSRGEQSAAIACAVQLLQHDPLREDVVRHLMALRAASGDRAGALLEYRRFEQRLRAEMDVAPLIETNALYDSIARQVLPARPVVSIPSSPTPAAPAVIRPNNLPAQLTSFVGREAELAAIRRMLTTGADATRLLTLTGPGGSGKTRLALEVASRMLVEHPDSFADGIFAVTLTHVSDPELAPAAIAGALGVKEQADTTALQSLSQWLHQKQALLVLDNFEQIVAAGPMVANLLAAAPGLFVIVTSRSPLRIYGEQEFPIQPLAVPDQEDSHDPETLARYASVHLFLTRSRAAKPNFSLTSDNATAIAELCVRLDGLPLALELAAARSKLFSPQAMLARLRDRLSFFADARLPARQQTLRATLDWSYHLLAEQEQRLLGRLAVFTGRFSLDAAERSCALDGDIDVLNALSGLVDHSLVQQVDLDDEQRGLFSMLATVHEYALLLLAATDEMRLRQQHADYYAGLTAEAHSNMSGGGQAVWMARLLAEEENIRSALEWSLRAGATAEQVATGVRIVTQLDRFWQIRGRVSEGYGWIMAALSRRVAIPTDYQVRVLNLAGSFAAMQGQLDVAAAHHEEALAVARSLGQSRLEAISLHNLGLTVGRSGDLTRANQLLSECLTLYRSTAGISSADLGSLLNNLAIVATRLNEFDRAVALLNESLALGRQRGDSFSMGHALSSLGELARRQGDLAQAAAHHRAALLLRSELNNQLGMLFSIQSIADLAIAANNLPLAVRLYGAGEALRQKYNAPLTGHILTDVQSNTAAMRAALPAQEFARLWAIGAGLSLDEAVRLALTIA